MEELNWKDLSLEELERLLEQLQGRIAQQLESRKKDALLEIQNLVKQHDLSFDEVVAAIRNVSRRGKAPALYRNPDNPRQTWSGKGKAPDWFSAAADPEELRIADM